MPLKTVLIINAHSHRNKGDCGIVIALIQGLRRTFPDCRITIAPLHWQDDADFYTKRYNCAVIRPAIVVPPRERPFFHRAANLAGQCASVLLRRGKFVEAARDCDLIISCGGGFLYSSNRLLPEATLLSHLAALYICGKVGRRLVIAPQSIGPFVSSVSRLLAISALGRADLLCVREPLSLKLVQDSGLAGAFLTPDCGFSLMSQDCDYQWARSFFSGITGKKAGLTLRSWARSGNQEQYLAAVGKGVEYLCAKGYTVLILPQVTGPTADEDDRHISRELALRFRDNSQVRYLPELEQATPERIKAAYGQLDLLLATRLHSAIFALAEGVPSVCIAYQPKATGVFAMLGCSPYCLPLQDISSQSLIAAIDLALDTRAVSINLAAHPDFFELLQDRVCREHSSNQ